MLDNKGRTTPFVQDLCLIVIFGATIHLSAMSAMWSAELAAAGHLKR